MLFWHLGVTAAVVFFTLGRRRIDYRMVLLGAILPDLIDKPVGRILFEKEFQNGRLFGHTLLFSVVLLLAVMLFLRGPAARRFFVLPIASLLHLVLDGMWSDPVTFFWPLFGTEFPKLPYGSYWLDVLRRPLEHPIVALQELIGLGLLIYLAAAYGLFKKDRLADFIRTGKLTDERPSRSAEESITRTPRDV